MNNMNEVMGVSITSTIPGAYKTGIDVYSDIRIEFSADIDTSTLKNCMLVLADKNNIYDSPQALRHRDKFDTVSGSIKYSERVLRFIPSAPLDTDTRYVVIINNTIKDITGLSLRKKHIFTFNTEVIRSFGKAEIIQPSYGIITRGIPEIHWKEQGAPSYIMHVSKSPDFETLLYENFIVPDDENTYMSKNEPDIQPEEIPPEERPYRVIFHTPDFNKKEGVYYIRVKAEGGRWSDAFQFFIKETTDAVVAADDQNDELYLDEFLSGIEDEIEILELFPPDGSILNSLKTNIFYVKMSGKVSEDRIEYPELRAYGEAVDEKDEQMGYEHGEVKGSWTLVYDETHDCTYLIFTPEPYDGSPEDKVISALQGGAISPIEGEGGDSDA